MGFEPWCHNIDIEKVPDVVLVSAHSYCFMVPVCEKNKRLSGAFTRAVNSLKTRESPKQGQICIKKHKNVKLQATHTLAKGSQKRIQMMMQSPNDYVFSFPEPAQPYNRDTNKKTARQNLTRGLRPESQGVVKLEKGKPSRPSRSSKN